MDNNLSFSAHVGNRIKFYRKTKKMSLGQLAAAIHKSNSTLSKYENGIIPVSVDVLFDISQVLDINVSQFVDYEIPNPAPDALNHTKAFGGRNNLYLYYYDGRTKRITKTLLVLKHDDSVGNETPCYCYMDVPSFDSPFDCKYFYTGTVKHHELITYVDLRNQSFKMEELTMCILNPFHHTQKSWGLMLCISYNPITPMMVKFLVSPHILADRTENDKEELMNNLVLTKNEIKTIKNLNMVILNTQEP